jgi:hypothetical protein
MDRDYPALRVVSSIHKFVGILVGVGGILILLFALLEFNQPNSSSSTSYYRLFIGFAVILGGVFTFAFGSLIDLLMDIEQNTRISTQQRLQSSSPGMDLSLR